MLVYQRLRENCSGKVLKGKQMVDLTKNGGWNHPQDMVEKKNNTRWEMWIFTNYGDVMDIYKKHL